MKTPNEITELNYNDVAFFKNEKTSEAKWDMAHFFYDTHEMIEENLTKSGVPIISISNRVAKEHFETKIRSCSELDGLNMIDYIIETYNKEIPTSTVKEFCESLAFSKALKFTGKHSIINEILNDEQLLKCQKYWLFKNTYNKNNWSKNCVSFINSNEWSVDFLISKGFSKEDIYNKLIAEQNE